MTTKTYKPTIYPNILVNHDEKNEGLDVEVDLPAVDKKLIDLIVDEFGFCVYAERDDEIYEGCYQFAHSVNKNKAKATYGNGLLRFNVPFKESVKKEGVKVHIE